MRTARQVSAGGVIARQHQGRTEVCLIARRRDDGEVVWGLPKGHVEPGERFRQTARREVREETGLSGEPLRKIGAITYWFVVRAGPRKADNAEAPAKLGAIRYFKTVHFYLLRYLEGRTSDHDDEVEEAAWFSLEQALTQLSYDNERRILRKASEMLSKESVD